MQALKKSVAVPSIWPALIVCALAAVLIDLGTLHRGEHADTFMYSQISLYRWTPFFWELDRVGSLVPLLALPFKSPLPNLLVQGAINTCFTLGAFVLLARYLLRDATYAWIGLISAAAFIALTPKYFRSEMLLNSIYGPWLAITLAGLVLAERQPDGSRRWSYLGLSVVLLATAHWVYCTAFVFFAPLVVFRSMFRAGSVGQLDVTDCHENTRFITGMVLRVWAGLKSELVVSLCLLGIGAGAGFAIREAYATPCTEWGTLVPEEWLPTFEAMAANTANMLAPLLWPQFLVVLAAAGIVLMLVLPEVRQQAAPAWRAAAALMATSLVIACAISTRQHVQTNQYAFRYLFPSVFFLQAALTTIGLSPMLAAIPSSAFRTRLFFSTALPLVCAAAIASYGWPSFARVQRDVTQHHFPGHHGLEDRQGIDPQDVIDARCTHIAGHYWNIWPAVFNANMALHNRGEHQVVWGISNRSTPTRDLWSKIPLSELCVAIPAGGDPEADYHLKYYGFPELVIVDRRRTAWILRPKVSQNVTPGTSDPRGIDLSQQNQGTQTR